MPIKWTIENDRRLLLTVLKTHKICIDSAQVAAQWPDDDDTLPRPTWRSVSERLNKLRSTFNYTTQDFNVTKSDPDRPKRERRGRPRKSANDSSSTATTPSKAKATAATAASSSGSGTGSGKRKRVKKEEPDSDDDDDDIEIISPTAATAASRGPFSTPRHRSGSKAMAGTPSAGAATPTPASRRGGSAASAAAAAAAAATPTGKAEGLRAPSVGGWDFVDGLDRNLTGTPIDGSGLGMVGGLDDDEVDFFGGFGGGAGVGGVGGAFSRLTVERQGRGATANADGFGGVAAVGGVKMEGGGKRVKREEVEVQEDEYDEAEQFGAVESERNEYQDDGLDVFF
ncbi:MAG: hypothetical protein Q9165_004004 [Trypethelium subeluteriae]